MRLAVFRATCALMSLLAGGAAVHAQAPSPPLTIERVVARFLERNLAVEAARHRVDVARAEQIAAGLYPNPTLTLSAENLKLAGSTPAGDLYEVGATYSQPIEWSDQRRYRREVADATVAVAEAELAETLGQRLRDVKRGFYEAALARQALEHARANREAFDALVGTTEARFKEGAVAEAEVLKVRLERGRLDTAVAQAQLAQRQAVIKLLDLLGDTDFSSAGVSAVDPGVPRATVPGVATLRAEALQRRPSVRAAEHAARRAERVLALERARRAPDVAPFVGLRRVGENSTVLLGVAIPLPILDRNEGGIARAAAEERVARVEVALRRNQTLAEVESAYQAWESAQARLRTFEAALLRQADESRGIALRAYEEGAIELIGYLEAQRTHADIRLQYLQTVLDAHVALLALEHAVGRELGR
jgi:cobalt-zinc-cadmium efflux system outer membrane protein